MKFNIQTDVESYRSTKLDFCTYHYFMMRGRVGGHYSLDEYAKASRSHAFKTSLPSPEDMIFLNL